MHKTDPRVIFLTRIFCSFLILLCVLSSIPISVSAATPPDITWCTVESLDEYAVLHFETPAEYTGRIDAYEFRTADVDWIRIADGQGGTLQLPNGGTVYLRCSHEGDYSTVWSTYVQFGDTFIMQDSVSGASVAYRSSSAFPNNAYLSADRITSGKVFDEVQQAVQTSKHFELYDIYFLYAQGLPFDPKDAAMIRLPLGDKLKRGHCKVFYVDEIGKRMLVLEASYDRTCITFRSRGAGLYFVTDEHNGTDPIPSATAPAMGSVFDFYGARLLHGDADGDFAVTAADARLVLRASVGLETIDIKQTECADTDWDGLLTAADARTVLRYSAGL